MKYALGLSKKPFVRLSGLSNRINTAHTRDLIRRLNQEAITVLKNKNDVLPLDVGTREVAVLNVGDAKEIQPFLKDAFRNLLILLVQKEYLPFFN